MTPVQTSREQVLRAGVCFVVLVFSVLGYGVATAEAAELQVDFEATPLFLDADVKPGDSTTRTVTVTNTEAAAEAVFVSVANTFDTGLASVMELVVSDGTTEYFSGSFLDFFANTPLPLGSVAGGATTGYGFTASLPSTVGNPYQNKQLGFDLIIGWNGGSVTDTNVRRTGGGRGQENLSVFNEMIANLDVENGAVTITWNTNLPATSYLVCGDITETPIVLQTQPPLFGYQFVVPEIDAQTIDHSMLVTNLAARTYECRPASRTSTTELFTVGAPLSFTIPTGQVEGASVSVLDSPDLAELIMAVQDAYNKHAGSVLGVSSGGKGSLGAPTYDEWLAELEAEQTRRADTEATGDSATTGVQTTHDAEDRGEARTEPERESSFPTQTLLWLLVSVILASGFWYWYRRQ